jgi:ribosome maturation factor RimP
VIDVIVFIILFVKSEKLLYLCGNLLIVHTKGSQRFPFLFVQTSIMNSEIETRIAQLLDEKYATDEAFADCFTVEITLKPGQNLYVFADSDSGMTFEKCQKLSRHLEAHLDTNGWLGEQYVLEVSSPGIGRPLKFVRQYVRNIGRTVQVTLKDNTEQTGLLRAVEAEHIVIEQQVIEKEGNKKKKVTLEIPLTFENIEKTIVKIGL